MIGQIDGAGSNAQHHRLVTLDQWAMFSRCRAAAVIPISIFSHKESYYSFRLFMLDVKSDCESC